MCCQACSHSRSPLSTPNSLLGLKGHCIEKVSVSLATQRLNLLVGCFLQCLRGKLRRGGNTTHTHIQMHTHMHAYTQIVRQSIGLVGKSPASRKLPITRAELPVLGVRDSSAVDSACDQAGLVMLLWFLSSALKILTS